MEKKSNRPTDFEKLVYKYENHLFRTALAITGNKADAEDIVQEVFIRAYEKAPQFETEDHEKAWMLRVTINLCNNVFRSLFRKRTEPLLESYPAKTKEQNELISKILKLPIKYRTVIYLYYYEGYATKEIALLLNKNESTIRSQLARAREQLKQYIKEDENERIQ